MERARPTGFAFDSFSSPPELPVVMSSNGWGRLAATTSALAILPGVTAAGAVDPSAVVDASVPVRAAGSFVLVLLFGGGLLYLAEAFVERSVDASMESPLKSVVYGVAAQGVVVFLGIYAISQLSRLGGAVVEVATVAMAVFVLALAGLGFTVVGVRLTETTGGRRLRLGAVVGATISAVVWLAPSFVLGSFAWILVASVGVGGPTERWLHASKAVDEERAPGN